MDEAWLAVQGQAVEPVAAAGQGPEGRKGRKGGAEGLPLQLVLGDIQGDQSWEGQGWVRPCTDPVVAAAHRGSFLSKNH